MTSELAGGEAFGQGDDCGDRTKTFTGVMSHRVEIECERSPPTKKL